MTRFLKHIILIFFLLNRIFSYAQKFEGGAVIGGNASQIDGDMLAGYHKVGINAGFFVKYPFNQKFRLQLEFLYTQKGAFRTINENNIVSSTTFDRNSMHFIEVPLMAGYTYKKFNIQAGLSEGYLIGARVKDFTGVYSYTSHLKKLETCVNFGLEYPIDKQLAVNLRWQYTVFSLAKGDKRNIFSDNFLSRYILGFYNNVISLSLRYTFKQ